MENADRLDQIWVRLGDEIKKKEAELEELRRKFKAVDDARLIIIAETTASESAILRRAAERADQYRPQSLQEEVLKCVNVSKKEGGLSASEVVKMLQAIGYKTDSKRPAFYASVYVTLKRLAQKGEIIMNKSMGATRFSSKDSTASLFAMEDLK